MKKKANKKGFTIMEMLIVVAIIAVLVAIAIPTFNGALTKSKEAADVANIRAAYAELQVAMLTNNAPIPADENDFWTTYGNGVTLNYNATTVNTTTSATDKLMYAKAADGKSATITYAATKVGGNDGKTYTWKVTSPDVE